MYKIYTRKSGIHLPRIFQKILLIMRLTIVILIATLMQVSAGTFAQKVNMERKNVKLQTVFKEIRKQTGYDFIYQANIIDNAASVNVKFSNVPFEEAMKTLFEKLPLTYSIDGKVVTVEEKQTPSFPDRVIDRFNNIDIRGRVVDEKGQPLSGATVKVKGTDEGTKTNENGEFALTGVDEKAVIVISFLGYKFKEINAAKELGNISLEISTGNLEEVNVTFNTGYQKLSRERSTGSFVQPIKELFDNRIAPDILGKLEGITNGLVFNQNTASTISGKLDLNIRGRSTIFANDQPLIVLDNFPYAGDIKDINPNDIENVTVLKDAAAASIWGARAGNGVIVITTKQGKLNQALKITANSNLTIHEKPDLLYNKAYLTSPGAVEVEKFLFDKGVFDPDINNITTFPALSPVVQTLALEKAGTISPEEATVRLEAFKSIDSRAELSKYFYRSMINQQNSLSLSGGSAKSSYFLSAGYDYNRGNIIANNNNRITVNSQNTFRLFTKLELSIGVKFVQNEFNSDNTLFELNPYLKAYSKLADDNGNPLTLLTIYNADFIKDSSTKGFLDWSYSPLNEIGLSSNKTKSNDYLINPSLRYLIIEGLNLEFRYQFEKSTRSARTLRPLTSYFMRDLINQYAQVDGGVVVGYNLPLGDNLTLNNADQTANNLRFQLNYDKKFGAHGIYALAGYEINETIQQSNGTNFLGYNSNTGTFSILDPLSDFSLYPSGSGKLPSSLSPIGYTTDRFRSVFANVGYSFKGKYFFTASARADGSNYFGVRTNQKTVPLWSIGAKWDLSKERFYDLPWLNSFILRATFGYNGNLNRSITGVTTFTYGPLSPYSGLPYASINNVGNPDLKWEKDSHLNLGLDLAIFDNRISASFEYFYKKGLDLIGDENVAPTSGLSIYRGNFSQLQTKGIDVSIRSQLLTGDFKWTNDLIVNVAKDKITRYDGNIATSDLTSADFNINPKVGYPLYSIFSYKWAGLNPLTGDPQGYLNGTASTDYINLRNPLSISDLVFNGSARPTTYGSFINRFSYKAFSLAVNFIYKFGYYFQRPSLSYSNLLTNSNHIGNEEYYHRWTTPGDEKFTNVPSMNYPVVNSRDGFYQNAQINIERGDNIRLKDIILSYTWVNKRPSLLFNDIQFSLIASNLGVVWRETKAKIDPDYPSGLPLMNSLSLGAKINF